MDTFPSLFQQQARTRNSDTAIRLKRHGLWESWTWGQADIAVREAACGLAANGLKSNDKLAIIGGNIPELYFAMIAAQCLGAVPVPIHPDSSSKELVYSLNDCEAKIAMVQDQQQVDALMALRGQCPGLTEVMYKDGRGMQGYDVSNLSSFERLRYVGKKFSAEHPQFFEEETAKVTQDTNAFILYTSGTAGHAHGAVHTHNSLINTGKAFAGSEEIQQDEQALAFMPISYAASSLFVYTLWLLKGFTINCPENNETVMMDFRDIGPTIVYAPPHFYKQLYSEITARAQRSKSKSFDKWFKMARKNHEKILSGKTLSATDRIKRMIGNVLMFGPLANVYGLSNLRKAYTGGDSMSDELFNFMRGIGINLKKTYGTAEAAGLICVQGTDQLNTLGGESSMGVPLPGVEIKQMDNGEIAFKGINTFKEYYRDPEATAAVKSADGWVRTGDMGSIDDKGALKISERVDALGQFSTGDTFAPHLVENALKSSPYIKEAVAVGDGKDAIVVFVVIDGDTVGAWAEARAVRFTGYRDLATKDEVYNLVSKTVEDVNEHIDQIEGKGSPPIKRFLILHREFNVDVGEITRSRKIRRGVVMSRHKDLVDALYSTQQTYAVKDASSGEIIAELKLKSA